MVKIIKLKDTYDDNGVKLNDEYYNINKIIDGGKDLIEGSTISRGQSID
jgi:hypothetical protein